MQQRIAKQVLADLRRRSWTDGQVVPLRKGVCAIEITAPDGERTQYHTVDDVRIKVKLLQHRASLQRCINALKSLDPEHLS